MDGLVPLEKDFFIEEANQEYPPFEETWIKNISSVPLEKEYSILTQFFLMLHRYEPGMTALSLKDRSLEQRYIREVIAHHDERKIVFHQYEPIEAIITQPNPDSMAFIQSSPINPVIKDLLGNPHPLYAHRSREHLPSKGYELDIFQLEPLEDSEFDEVFSFLKSHSPWSPAILLYPYGWNHDSSLKESIALKYFAHKCNHINLLINTAGDVKLLSIK
ncbi:hypothetical protein [Bacillus sp. SJS]|uniref:hypothetical protein n=1 Tax=Bacillus sp. SJS TaxID=1423321 RepID=UPI0004DD4F82|nr:hypothetical protein [Bacillus sp. SJS]KZZ83958.1 hypothetical protein AS29_012210 [Bacillus sp. SJS]